MKIKVLGTGPDKTTKTRLQSSILIDNKILVDATPSIDKQLSKKTVEAVLITHAHSDAISGLKKIEKYTKLDKLPVYCLKHTKKHIKDRIGDRKIFEFRVMKPWKSYTVLGRRVKAIPVEHSVIHKKFDPTAAFKIGNLIYAEDVDYKYFYSPKSRKLRDEMKRAKLNILDAAMCKGNIRGHLNIFKAHNFLVQKGITNVAFTQLGRTCEDIENIDEKIKPMRALSDGDEFTLSEQFVETLSETKPGLKLDKDHAKMIWQENKDIIVLPKNYKFSSGKSFYLIGGNECYGIITIKKIRQVDIEEFRNLEERHRISDKERKKKWAGEQILYRNDFSVDKKFDSPKLVKAPKDSATFMRNVEFVIGNITIGMIKDVRNYSPEKLRTSQLRDDFRISLAWHASKSKGKKIPYSKEEIENLIQLIMEELLRRGTKFHPDKMTPHSRKIYKEIMDRIASKSMSEDEFELMRQAFGSPGGKSHLAKKLMKYFPSHKTYVEGFAGGAAIFWKKEPSDKEVLNDLDSEIAHAYRFMKQITPKQIKALKKKNWRANKKRFFKLLKSDPPSDPVDRYYRFMYVNHHSYGTSRKTFGYKFNDNYKPYIRLESAKDRLKGVKIYSQDYLKIIDKFDSEDTFFYLDPPYPEEWPGPEGVDMWTEKDIKKMASKLSNIKGKFMVSINNLKWIKKEFGKYNFNISKVKNKRFFRNTTGNKYELIVTNYDTKEAGKEKKLSRKPKFLDKFPDLTIIKDAVSVVGSSIENDEYEDIDILVRMKKPTDFIKRAIQTRITKSLPEKMSDKLHFIWGDPEGPHDNFVPVYDLILSKKAAKIVKMSGISPMSSFRPMKPKKRFYRLNKVLKYIYPKGEPEKYEIEKKYNGFRAVIHKKDNKVKILSDQKKDITFPFPTIVRQSLKLSDKDFIIDCELVPFKGNTPLGRREAARYIGAVRSHRDIDDSNVKFYAFDIVYFDGEDISDKPWHERYQILKKLNFKDNIKEVAGVVVNNKKEAEKAIKMFRKMKGSEGAIIKRFDGKYRKNRESGAWIKFRNELLIHGRILNKLPVEGAKAWRYLLGIDLKEKQKDKINKKYMVDGRLKLGRTFNTSIDASEGDILDVRVEEVWRHKYKSGRIRYSIHKPNPDGLSKKNTTTSLSELDSMVVSRGAEVREHDEGDAVIVADDPELDLIEEIRGHSGVVLDKLSENYYLVLLSDAEEPIHFSTRELKSDDEGRERIGLQPKDFPKKTQEEFRKVKESGKWKKFVFQWHYRGHKITPEEHEKEDIPEDFRYWLRSLHTDTRYEVNNHLQGITLLNPTTTDKSQESRIGPDLKDVRGVLKLPQPKSWLKAEGTSPVGAPGTTRKAPAVFIIVAKGKYRPVVVEDHRIILELDCDKGDINRKVKKDAESRGIYITRYPTGKLKKLPKYLSYHIAHIGDKHIILADGMDKIK